MNVVAFTKVKAYNGWLSNMSAFPVIYENTTWKNAEALFQALRFPDGDIRTQIYEEKSPMSAKMIAKKHVENMTVVQRGPQDVDNMLLVLMHKLKTNPNLCYRLRETGDAQIIEDVTARGSSESNDFWGARQMNGEWVGENMLGELWMLLRTMLNDSETQHWFAPSSWNQVGYL